MKKSLLALAVLGAFAGVASAQSSVTLYGTLDVNGRYVKNSGTERRFSMGTDGINSSQLGFRGVEDLGGGLRAGFTLLAGTGPDGGTAGSGNKFFNRRSTVSLFSSAGELRLGRDYLPTFWNQTIFDAFGTNGLGASNNIRQAFNGVRSDNSIGYFLPGNLGGFYGQAMVSASEGGTTNAGGSSSDRVGGRVLSARLGFAAGPFDVAASYGTQRYGAATTVFGGLTPFNAPVYAVSAGQSQKTWNVGGAYDFGFLKLLGYYDHNRVTAVGAGDLKETMYSVSTVIPMGQGEVHLGYERSKLKTSSAAFIDPTVDQFAATYQYNLSKRTAMYGTVSRLANKDATRLTLGGAPNATPAPPTAGGNSRGFELGVRHFF
ncbi:MAG: porin [Hyphomicrobium sp.]|nr:porin [Hyphomicrobium sp.]